MTVDAIERMEALQQLLDEYSQDIDALITIKIRRRDWMTLAILWWYFGGSAEMDAALGREHDRGYGRPSLPFTPCMSTNCNHGPDCGREREALEQTLLKFIEG